MSLKLVFAAATGQLEAAIKQMQLPIATAGTAAIRQAAEIVKAKGRSEIASGGFGAKWQKALRVEVYPKSGVSIDAAMLVHHKIPYAGVFERGAAISGSPLLWLPIGNGPTRVGGRRLTPRSFIESVGPLVSMHLPGRKPMLGSYISGRARKVTIGALKRGNVARRTRRLAGASQSAGLRLVPIFIGVSRVQLKKRFNLYGVFNQVRGQLGALYLQNAKVG